MGWPDQVSIYKIVSWFSVVWYTLPLASGEMKILGWYCEISAIKEHVVYLTKVDIAVFLYETILCTFPDLLSSTCPPGLGWLLSGQPGQHCHGLPLTTATWASAQALCCPLKQGPQSFLAQIWLDCTHKGYDFPCTSGLWISITSLAKDWASLATSYREWIS